MADQLADPIKIESLVIMKALQSEGAEGLQTDQ